MDQIGLLSHDHSDIDELFSKAVAALDRGDDAFGLIDNLWARLAVHIRAEHLHLFPAISAVAERDGDASALQRLSRLRADHDFFMKSFASMMNAARAEDVQGVRASLTGVSARLADHNSIEESEVYPLLEKWIDETDRGPLLDRMQAELENAPLRFAGADWRRSS